MSYRDIIRRVLEQYEGTEKTRVDIDLSNLVKNSGESILPLVDVNLIITVEELAAYQQVGREMQVEVSVLARAGALYIHRRNEEVINPIPYLLQQGEVAVRVFSYEVRDLTLFNERVLKISQR